MIEITEDPIDLTKTLGLISDASCGAQVLFVGTTRQWTKNVDGDLIETSHLIYEAYREMAEQQMHELEKTARAKWPVKQAVLVHRIGHVGTKEPSVAVAVSCPHRGEAFEAARWLIDELKHQVPIWKQEHYVQNGAEWIHPTNGSCGCDHSEKATRPASESRADSDWGTPRQLPTPQLPQ